MVVVETSIFTKQVISLLSDDEYRKLQAALINRPGMGAIVQGGGGIRKIRWGLRSKGKSGGIRVIYYWAVAPEQILMLLIYAKNEQDDLTPDQVRELGQAVKESFP